MGILDRIGQGAGELIDGAGDALSDAADSVKEAATGAADTVAEVASDVAETVGEGVAEVREAAGDAIDAVEREAAAAAQWAEHAASDTVDALRRNLMTPDTYADAHERYLNGTESGQGQVLMRELVDRLKDRDGDPALSADERARLEAAIGDVHGPYPTLEGSALASIAHGVNPPRPITAEEVGQIASRLGITLAGDGNAPVTALAPDSVAARYVNALEPQTAADGVGPLIVRDYAVTIEGTSADAVFRDLQQNFPRYIDPAESHFYPASAGPLAEDGRIYIQSHMRVPGEEVLPDDVHTGVRVKSIDGEGNPRTITLETLANHPEAGQITFSVRELDNGRVEVSIHSEARFGGRAAQAAYGPVGRDSQTRIWEGFLNRAVDLSGGTRVGPNRMDYAERE